MLAWLEEKVDNVDPPVSDALDGIPADMGLQVKPPPPKYKSDIPGSTVMWPSTRQSPTLSRIDLYQKLLDTYTSEKARWDQFKLDARPEKFYNNESEVDAYDRGSLSFNRINFAGVESAS